MPAPKMFLNLKTRSDIREALYEQKQRLIGENNPDSPLLKAMDFLYHAMGMPADYHPWENNKTIPFKNRRMSDEDKSHIDRLISLDDTFMQLAKAVKNSIDAEESKAKGELGLVEKQRLMRKKWDLKTTKGICVALYEYRQEYRNRVDPESKTMLAFVDRLCEIMGMNATSLPSAEHALKKNPDLWDEEYFSVCNGGRIGRLIKAVRTNAILNISSSEATQSKQKSISFADNVKAHDALKRSKPRLLLPEEKFNILLNQEIEELIQHLENLNKTPNQLNEHTAIEAFISYLKKDSDHLSEENIDILTEGPARQIIENFASVMPEELLTKMHKKPHP